MKIFLVLALGVLTSSSAFECPEPDVFFGSSPNWFNYMTYVASWEDCGRACATTSNCNFWTWDMDNMYEDIDCLLYETDTGLHHDDHYISGERGCPEDQPCKEDFA